jgi:hypothetical protein
MTRVQAHTQPRRAIESRNHVRADIDRYRVTHPTCMAKEITPKWQPLQADSLWQPDHPGRGVIATRATPPLQLPPLRRRPSASPHNVGRTARRLCAIASPSACRSCNSTAERRSRTRAASASNSAWLPVPCPDDRDAGGRRRFARSFLGWCCGGSAEGGSRTHMALRPRDFESRASTVPPLRPSGWQMLPPRWQPG